VVSSLETHGTYGKSCETRSEKSFRRKHALQRYDKGQRSRNSADEYCGFAGLAEKVPLVEARLCHGERTVRNSILNPPPSGRVVGVS
jgi:hypothetical protein